MTFNLTVQGETNLLQLGVFDDMQILAEAAGDYFGIDGMIELGKNNTLLLVPNDENEPLLVIGTYSK